MQLMPRISMFQGLRRRLVREIDSRLTFKINLTQKLALSPKTLLPMKLFLKRFLMKMKSVLKIQKSLELGTKIEKKMMPKSTTRLLAHIP
jgi:hypothetical protein